MAKKFAKPIGKQNFPTKPLGGWARTGGAMGDPNMDQLDKFNKDRAGVDQDDVRDTFEDGGDPNAGIHLLKERLPGSEI